jgi:hypothetical protein
MMIEAPALIDVVKGYIGRTHRARSFPCYLGAADEAGPAL